MKLPTLGDVGRNALLALASAIVVAAVVGQLPELREWLKRQWREGSA